MFVILRDDPNYLTMLTKNNYTIHDIKKEMLYVLDVDMFIRHTKSMKQHQHVGVK